MKIKIIGYILLLASLLLSSCSHTQRKTTVKRQDVIENNSSKKILAKIRDMELLQLAEFYKENRYEYLRDAIAKKIFSAKGSISDLEGAAELFSFDDILYRKIQRHIEDTKIDMLEKASEMDLSQLSNYFKENQYDFLREAISESVSSLDGSLEALKDAAELFLFDEQIYALLQERVEYKKEQQRKLYKKIYFNNCDSLLSSVDYVVSCKISEYIGELVSTMLIDSIFYDELPEEKYLINKKANNWVWHINHKVNEKILVLYKQFIDEENIKRRDFVEKYNMSYNVGAEINIYEIVNSAEKKIPHQNNTYPELYLISDRQNSSDWLGRGLWVLEKGSNFIPVYGRFIAMGLGWFNTWREIDNLVDFRNEMIQYSTIVSKKIFNELQDESYQRIQYINTSIKKELKKILEI